MATIEPEAGNPGGEKLQPKQRVYLWAAVLLTLLAYGRVVDNGFINIDDPDSVLANPVLQHPSLHTLLTSTLVGNWIPLTNLSLALDFRLGGLNPWVYHFDSLIFHALNTALVFLLSLKLFGFIRKPDSQAGSQEPEAWAAPAAFGAAILFGLHPIHVESVAWASERKDLLCAFFYLPSLGAYLDFAARSAHARWNYAQALGFFILALLSKPMAVSLPFVLVLLDLWPLGRFRRHPRKAILEKIPFLAASLLAGGVTLFFQSLGGGTPGFDQVPLSFRLMNACHALVFYSAKLAWPAGLAAHYPALIGNTYSFAYVLSALLVVLFSAFCLWRRRARPALALGWFYFCVTLAPVLGFIQVGNQAAADRFTYLPSLGPCVLVSALLVRSLSNNKPLLLAIAVAGSALLGWRTFEQVFLWKDSVTLLENALRVAPHNQVLINNNLGMAYQEAGRFDEALAQYDSILAGGLALPLLHEAKGKIFLERGRLDDAVQEFKTAISLDPRYPPYYNDLSLAFLRLGRPMEAFAQIDLALRMSPSYAAAHDTIGLIYRQQNRTDEAIAAFRHAHFLDPGNEFYLRNLLTTLQQAGRNQECLDLYQEMAAMEGASN
jgi:tetratricopeptide (TPR) repeat protein